MKSGQFGTTVENEQFGNIIKSDRERQYLEFKYYAKVVCAPFGVGQCGNIVFYWIYNANNV